jgi:hypothetical protein
VNFFPQEAVPVATHKTTWTTSFRYNGFSWTLGGLDVGKDYVTEAWQGTPIEGV